MPGVARTNVTYLTMQVTQGERTCAPWWSASCRARQGTPRLAAYLVAGVRSLVALRGGGRHRHRFQAGRQHPIRRNHYTVVGLTRRMVSSSGDPMVFIP